MNNARTLLLTAFAVRANFTANEAAVLPSVFEAASRTSGQSVGTLLRRSLGGDNELRDFLASEARRIAALPAVHAILADR